MAEVLHTATQTYMGELLLSISEALGQWFPSGQASICDGNAFVLVPANSRWARELALAMGCCSEPVRSDVGCISSVRNQLGVKVDRFEIWELGDVSRNTSGLDLVIDLGVFDDLLSASHDTFCRGVADTLRPGGLFACATEEAEAFGQLKRCMRGLRPAVEARLDVRPLCSNSFDDHLDDVHGAKPAMHIYRRACENPATFAGVSRNGALSSSDDSHTAKVTKMDGEQKRSVQAAPSRWTQEMEFVQSSRPNVNPEKILAAALAQASDTSSHTSHVSRSIEEPSEWVSDSIDVAFCKDNGRGLITTRAVETGELLSVTKTLFLAPAQMIAPAVFKFLTEPGTRTVQKQQFYSLFDGDNGDVLPPMSLYKPQDDRDNHPGVSLPSSRPPMERVYRILKFCGLQADKLQAAAANDPGIPTRQTAAATEEADAASGVWPLVALMNHSCCPTVTVIPLTSYSLAMVATCNLPAGAQLTVRYVPIDVARCERNAALKEQKEFECSCRRCQMESRHLLQDDSQRLTLLQEKVAQLQLSQAELLTATSTLSDTVRGVLDSAVTTWEETHEVMSAHRDLKHRVLSGSFLSIFIALAMALDDCVELESCDAEKELLRRKQRDAWLHVTQILEQSEPCSPTHLSAATRYCASMQDRTGVADPCAIVACFSVWLGRHGALKACEGSSLSMRRISDADATQRRKLVVAFASAMAPAGQESTWISALSCSKVWGDVVQSLRGYGVYACSWASPEGSHQEQQTAVADASETVHTDLSYDWEQLSEFKWRLRFHEFTDPGDVDLDISDSTVRIRSSNRKSVELDMLTELGRRADGSSAKARFVKASSGNGSAHSSRPHLRVDICVHADEIHTT